MIDVDLAFELMRETKLRARSWEAEVALGFARGSLRSGWGAAGGEGEKQRKLDLIWVSLRNRRATGVGGKGGGGG